MPRETALSDLSLVSQIVVKIALLNALAHRRVPKTHITPSRHSDATLSRASSHQLQSELRNVRNRTTLVVTVVIQVDLSQHGEVHLILADRLQISQNGSLKRLSVSRIHARLDVVLAHLEVLHVHEVALLTVRDHVVQKLLETVSLEGTRNEHQTRRTRVLSQLQQTRNHRSIHHTRQQHITVQIHIDGSIVQGLVGKRTVPQIQRQLSHTSQSQHTGVSQSLLGISVADSEVSSRHIIILDHIVVASGGALHLAVITQNERIVDGEPGLGSGRRGRSRSRSRSRSVGNRPVFSVSAWFPIPALATSFLALDRGLGPVCPVSFCFFVFYPEALSEPANKKTVYHNRQTASLLSVSRLDYVRSGHVLRREPRCLFLHT